MGSTLHRRARSTVPLPSTRGLGVLLGAMGCFAACGQVEGKENAPEVVQREPAAPSSDPRDFCDASPGGPPAQVEVHQLENGDIVFVSTFDEEGRKVYEHAERAGVVTAALLEVRVFDERGLLVRSTTDVGLDGTVDAQTVFERNADGLEVLTLSDNDGDGKWERSVERSYDAVGRVEEEVVEEFGVFRIRLVYSYFEEGYEVWTDDDDDGEPERYYSLTDTPTLYLREWDQDLDGVIDRTEASEYDDQGRLLEYRVSQTSSGNASEQVSTYEYNDDGLLRRVIFEDEFESQTNTLTTHEYDSEGARTSTRVTRQPGGELLSLTAYRQTATGREGRFQSFDPEGGLARQSYELLDDDGFVFERGFDSDGDGHFEGRFRAVECE